MKNLLIIIITILLRNITFAQLSTTCFDQTPNTRTTDPNDNTAYSFSVSNINPNGNNGSPMNFDWVTNTTFPLYSVTGLTAANHTLLSPFYCAGGLVEIDGGCANNNTRIYNDINQSGASSADKLKALDILPEDGWELLKYNFGRAINTAYSPTDNGVGINTPFFWLYNRYTGKSKFFMAVTSERGIANSLNSAAIRFGITPDGQYDLLANAKPFTHILSDFDHTNDINATSYCDIQPIGTPAGAFHYYWLYAEFNFSYDPCVCRAASQNATLDFRVFTLNNATVQLQLDGTSTTNVFGGTGVNTDGKSNLTSSTDDNAFFTLNSNLINGTKAAIQGYKDWKEYADKIKDYFNSETSTGTPPPTNHPLINLTTQIATMLGQGSANFTVQTSVASDYINGTNVSGSNPNPKYTEDAIQTLAGLSPLIEDLASAAPYVGAFIALTNFMSDAGSNENQVTTKPAAPPAVNVLSAKITGGIQYSSNVTNGSLYLPGLKSNQNFSTNNSADNDYPIYNNPLGVFNIVSVPDFEYKSISLTNNGVDANDPNIGYSYNAATTFSGSHHPSGTTVNPFADVSDYRLSGPVKYVLNPASNLSVKSIDACFVLEYNGTDPLFLKHSSQEIVDFFHITGTNPAGFTGTCTGNSDQKQIPYYPGMKVELDPFNLSLITGYEYSDSFSDIIAGYKSTGIEPEYVSTSYTTALGMNGADEVIRFRTEYVPLQSLTSIDFLLIGKRNIPLNPVKVYLKLFCKFSKNDHPEAEPVTFITTYDITQKLSNAQSAGTGGSGSYNYYYVKDKGAPWSATKAGDYAMFNNLQIFGAYYTPNYGTTGPVYISSSTNGGISTGAINVANSTTLLTAASGYQTFGAMTDLTIGDDVDITTSASSQIASIRARNNISIGKGFFTANSTYTSNNIIYYAGNDITLNNSYSLGSPFYNNLSIYAGNNISLNHNASYSNIYTGTTDPYIINASLYAKNQISVATGTSAGQVYMGGEVTLSTQAPIPNAWALLHNDDGSTPITNLAASNSDIASTCSTSPISNRAANPADSNTVARKDSIVNRHVADSTPDYRIGIFPNPTTGNLNVNFLISESSTLQMTIEDITGKQLFQKRFEAVKGYSQSQMNLDGLMNGVYIIKISNADDGNIIKTGKIILSK